MKYCLAFLFFCCLAVQVQAQTVSRYFEQIRNDASALTAFFSEMPKGGDLHHHYSGSVYTETFVAVAIENDYYINKHTLEVSPVLPAGAGAEWARFSALKQADSLLNYKELITQKWSAKDYVNLGYPPHRQFFESFDKFGVAMPSFASGLLELKHRAKTEHVSYIETMLHTIRCSQSSKDLDVYDDSLRLYAANKQTAALQHLFELLKDTLHKRDISQCAVAFNNSVKQLHDSLQLDDDSFTMRYQTFVIRSTNPVSLFKNTLLAFEAANTSPLVVGVNIVAPEHYDVSMQDYWLHMQFFAYCHQLYPNVKYSMHAGELTLGLVKPEELTWHINAAVYDAHANRIGHGVDMAYEKDSYGLLRYMAKQKIPVEINLGSNEFILGVKESRHPIMLYKKANVPIVISTDDAGILRTNLIEQYVLLAMRYKAISYTDIKQFVYNSIHYSFIKEPAVKQALQKKLDADFARFEKKIMALK